MECRKYCLTKCDAIDCCYCRILLYIEFTFFFMLLQNVILVEMLRLVTLCSYLETVVVMHISQKNQEFSRIYAANVLEGCVYRKLIITNYILTDEVFAVQNGACIF